MNFMQSSGALIAHVGDDLTVVNAARVSMAKHSNALGLKDEKLIRYLAEHQHWTPFGHVVFTFHLKMPVFAARQWFRHTVGFVRNEVSRRYVDDPPEYYLPDEVRERPHTSIKQGSGGAHPRGGEMRVVMRSAMEAAHQAYMTLIGQGVAPEQARMVLPLAHMTEFYETASLAAYARLFKLRVDGHAQQESKDVALLIGDVIGELCPLSWAALTEGKR